MTKKKIAILTQPLGHNYGGIIQNYALQKVLKELGHVPITINRVNEVQPSKLRVFLSHCKAMVYRNIFQKNVWTRADYKLIFKHNLSFIERHINRSEIIDSTQKLHDYFSCKKFNSVIIGSDQTWRPKYSPDIYNFYLDFLKDNQQITKLAYASSFGTEDWEYTDKETEVCRELVQQFDAISVREESGVSLCKKYLNTEAVHLLDPTLLLSAKDYSELIAKPKQNKQLFTYVLDDTKEKLEFITNCAVQLGLKQTSSQAKYKLESTEKRRVEDCVLPPLEHWLQGFRDAEFVITDSFHGTVFSILNQKPFLSIANQERGAARFSSLLGQLGLADRLVYDANEIDYNILSKEINYKEVYSKLEVLKKESLLFLKNNLK